MWKCPSQKGKVRVSSSRPTNLVREYILIKKITELNSIWCPATSSVAIILTSSDLHVINHLWMSEEGHYKSSYSTIRTMEE